MRLRFVLDTNVMLVAVSTASPYHWIFEALVEERYDLVVSTPILLEYEEVVSRMMSRRAAQNLMGALVQMPSVRWIEPRFHWRLIAADPDDDKFVDCAVAGQADGLVTYDAHFNVLQQVDFPSVAVLTPEQMRTRLLDKT